MASIHPGIRPGTKPDARLGNNWKYVRNDSVGFEEIRNRERERMRFESAVENAISKTEISLLRMRVAYVYMHGGHVEKGVLAQAGLTENMDPNKVLELCLRDLPTNLADKAVIG